VLREEFLVPMGISVGGLTKEIGVAHPDRAHRSQTGRHYADTAMRLAKYFGTSTELWLNLQNHYDIQLPTRL
jgi:addiction module HigA family antidote